MPETAPAASTQAETAAQADPVQAATSLAWAGEELIGEATHQEAADTDETMGENALSDAASRAVIDISHGVQHVQISEAAISRMLGGEGENISSAETGEVETEHVEISDFDDGGSAGKVER